MADKLNCCVITPERQVLETPADSVVLPACDGQLGVMKDRAPLLCEVGIGVLKIGGTETGEQTFFVDGGFAQVLDNQVTVLTTRAIPASQIDRAAATKALADAESMKITDEPSFDTRQKALKRASTQIKLAGR